jgi:hypothetical protein
MLEARTAMREQGHDLIAVCDVRSEDAPAGGAGRSEWRWRFLAASCPADGQDERARTTPYLFSGGPPQAAAKEGQEMQMHGAQAAALEA